MDAERARGSRSSVGRLGIRPTKKQRWPLKMGHKKVLQKLLVSYDDLVIYSCGLIVIIGLMFISGN